ncbi:MAG: hypothetical protein AAF512_16980 [Pseudomonadota bacterium]
MLLQQFRDGQQPDAVAELENLGPPPYSTTAQDAIKSKYAGVMTAAEQHAVVKPPSLMDAMQPPAANHFLAEGISYPDPRQQGQVMYDILRPEVTKFDAWQLPLTFESNIGFIQGELDYFTVTAEVERYYDAIQAPAKQFLHMPGGGHSAFFMRNEFLAALNQVILP